MWSVCTVHMKPLFLHPKRFLTISLAHHAGVPKPVILPSGHTLFHVKPWNFDSHPNYWYSLSSNCSWVKITVCFKIQTFYRTVEYRSCLNISAFSQKNKTAIVKGLLFRACREALQEAVDYTDRVVVFLSTSLLYFRSSTMPASSTHSLQVTKIRTYSRLSGSVKHNKHHRFPPLYSATRLRCRCLCGCVL
jgi:hypothetical protein